MAPAVGLRAEIRQQVPSQARTQTQTWRPLSESVRDSDRGRHVKE